MDDELATRLALDDYFAAAEREGGLPMQPSASLTGVEFTEDGTPYVVIRNGSRTLGVYRVDDGPIRLTGPGYSLVSEVDFEDWPDEFRDPADE